MTVVKDQPTSDTDRQARHYEENAEQYVEARLASAAYARFLDRWAQRLLQPWIDATDAEARRGHVVLDPMCGHGNLAPFLLEHSPRVLLNDLSPEMLDYLDPAHRDRCEVLAPSDVCHLDLAGASVDVVVISGGLHHVSTQLDAALEEIARVLRPGGFLLFGEPSDDFAPVRLLRRTVYRASGSFDHETEQGFRYRALRAKLEGFGFGDVALRPFGSVGYLLMGQTGVIPWLKRTRSGLVLGALEGFDRMVEATPGVRRSCFALTGSARRR